MGLIVDGGCMGVELRLKSMGFGTGVGFGL